LQLAYIKEANAVDLPKEADNRAGFAKGLFQHTLNQFINETKNQLSDSSFIE